MRQISLGRRCPGPQGLELKSGENDEVNKTDAKQPPGRLLWRRQRRLGLHRNDGREEKHDASEDCEGPLDGHVCLLQLDRKTLHPEHERVHDQHTDNCLQN